MARDFTDWSMASIEVDEQRFLNIANQALQAEDAAMSEVRDFLCYGKWIDWFDLGNILSVDLCRTPQLGSCVVVLLDSPRA